MKRRLMDNLKLIAMLATLLVVLSGGLWKVWSMETSVKKNTEHRYTQEYGQLNEWVKAEEHRLICLCPLNFAR